MNLQHSIELPSLAKPAPNRIVSLSEMSIAAYRECIEALGSGYTRRLRNAAANADRFLATAAEGAKDLRVAMAPLAVKEIGNILFEFVTAWPNASNADLAGYGAQLVGDVIDKEPCRFALDQALRRLRQSSRFLPSIAEILAELDVSQSAVRNLAFRIQGLPALVEQIRSEADKRDRIDAQQRERRERATVTSTTA